MASDASVSMQKWGIPEDETVSAEVTLLERLVWVPYRDQWWPALLYSGYRELHAHLFNELDTVLKAQFAVAIMREMNEPQKIRVARLLGREILEVVEVDDQQYAEFYWHLPKVLPMACQRSRYGSDIKLYLDFHSALDQVEELIRDISERSFNLFPGEEKKTWVERAFETLTASERLSHTTTQTSSRRTTRDIFESNAKTMARIKKEANQQLLRKKKADDEEDANFLFSALDGMMENLNKTYDCVSGDTAQKIIETSVKAKPKSASSVNAYSQTIAKQKETRDALRKVIAKQREIRHSGNSVSSSNHVQYDDRNTSHDIKRSSSSVEVLPGLEADDIIPGIGERGILSFLNSKDEDETKYVPDRPRARSHHEWYGSSRGPETMEFVTSKTRKAVNLDRAQGHTFVPRQQSMDAREDDQFDERQAIMAAARAAATVELDISFWDHLLCNATDF